MREEVSHNPPADRAGDAAAPANGAPANGGPPRLAPPHGATSGATNGEAETPPWAAFSPARGRFVRFVVVLSVAATLLCAASVYWRSANVSEPTSYITIQGNEALNGTVVEVSSHALPAPVVTTLTKDNDYISTIFLHSGSYTVTATLNGEPLARGPFSVTGRKAASLNLTARRPTARSAAPASDHTS